VCSLPSLSRSLSLSLSLSCSCTLSLSPRSLIRVLNTSGIVAAILCFVGSLFYWQRFNNSQMDQEYPATLTYVYPKDTEFWVSCPGCTKPVEATWAQCPGCQHALHGMHMGHSQPPLEPNPRTFMPSPAPGALSFQPPSRPAVSASRRRVFKKSNVADSSWGTG